MNTNEIAELKGQMIDSIEDYLDQHSLNLIDNEERQSAIEDGEDEESCAKIYGSNYDYIGELIEDRATQSIQEHTYMREVEAFDLILSLRNRVCELLIPEDITLFKEHFSTLSDTLIGTLFNWGLLKDKAPQTKPYGYMLVEVRERDISTHQCKTKLEAYEMLKKRYDQIVHENDDTDEGEIGDFWSWVNGNYENYDSQIVEIA